MTSLLAMQNETCLGFKQKVNYNINYKLHGIAMDTKSISEWLSYTDILFLLILWSSNFLMTYAVII